MVETADIVVVGGGCIGAAIALHLAEKNAGKIILLEQKSLAHGASGKGIGIIRTHYTHPVLAELAQLSLESYHDFAERYGGYDAGFHPCGYYILVGEDDRQTLKDLVKLHRSLGIEVDLVDLDRLQDAIPALNLTDVAIAAYEPNSGYGSPPQTTIALARRAQDLGVDVRTDTPVREIKLDAEGRIERVITPSGEIATRTVVDCVGPWAKQFTEHLGLDFPVAPVVEHVVVVERPQEFSQPHPVVSDLVNLCYSRSDADQPYTRIGNSNPQLHSQFKLDNADDFHGQLFPHITEELTQKLLHRYPILKSGKIVDNYSGIWAITPDYQPIIDRIEQVPGLYCAVGFSGHGYKLSPVIGKLVSQLIVGETNTLVGKLKIFRRSRFAENKLIRSQLSYSKAQGLR
ncbi:FAD-binding oxidoreductase [Pleurocapsales cyanobacterium LEGE 10410]|nr:FAD-binding oxidoreductase [Pleurocapsales cyanobacterium LEGE 10410]